MDFSDPSRWVATGGIEHGDFVTFGEAFVDPFFRDLGAFGALFVRREGVDFGFGALGERQGAVEVADEVLGGGGFEPGDESAKLAGVAHGVAQAEIDGLQQDVAHGGGLERASTQGEALGVVVEDGDGRGGAFLEEAEVDAPPSGAAQRGVGRPSVVILRFVSDKGVVGRLESGGADMRVQEAGQGLLEVGGGFLGGHFRGAADVAEKVGSEAFVAENLNVGRGAAADGAQVGFELQIVAEEKDFSILLGPAAGLLDGEPGFAGAGSATDEELGIFLQGVEDFKALAGVLLQDGLGEIKRVAAGLVRRGGGVEAVEQAAGLVGRAFELAVGETGGPPFFKRGEVASIEDAEAGLALVEGLVRRDGEVRKREDMLDEGRGVALLIGGGAEGVQHAFPLGFKLVEGILAVGSRPASGGGIHSARAALGLDNEDVAIGALDDEVPFPPDAAVVLVKKSPADAKLRPEHGEKRGDSLLALGAGIRRGGVNPAGHLFK